MDSSRADICSLATWSLPEAAAAGGAAIVSGQMRNVRAGDGNQGAEEVVRERGEGEEKSSAEFILVIVIVKTRRVRIG